MMEPTNARSRVVRYAVILAVVTYIDRVAISQAESHITSEFHLTATQMGYVFAMFTWTYSLFEVPSGWIGDRFGARRVLTRIVLWWSFFTAATGWAWNFASLLVTRGLFGAGEAGCFPNIARMMKTWLPADERVRAQGMVWLAARWGGAFTPLLVWAIFQVVSWRVAFGMFGVLGVVWAFFFSRWYRDNPSLHPQVNAAENALIERGGGGASAGSDHGAIPWRAYLRSPTVWLLWAQYVCMCYGWWFYITWLPRYLREARGLDAHSMKGAALAMLPLFFGGIGSFFSGAMAARLAQWLGSVARARRLATMVAFMGASAFLLVSVFTQNVVFAMIAMGCASFCNDLALPHSWGACMDVGGKYAGTLSGSMNMMGNFGGSFAPIATGMILQATGGNWAMTFYVSAAVYFVGALCWLFIDPVTPLEA